MRIWKSVGHTLALLCVLAASGCGVSTRLAVKNSGADPIDVKVSRGSDSTTFSAVAAGTTSAFKDIEWDDVDGVKVETGGKTTAVDLTAEQDNTIDVAADGTVTVQATKNEESSGW
jgi:hypothetical protein